MNAKVDEMLLDLFSVEEMGYGDCLGWFYDEEATLRPVGISQGEYAAATRWLRQNPDRTVTIAR